MKTKREPHERRETHKKNPIFQSETNEKTEHLQPRTSRKARNPGTYGTWRRNRESSLWTTRREGSSRTTRQAHATEESSLEKLMSTPPTYLRVSDPWGSSVGEEGNFHGKSSCAISFFFSWSCSLKKEVKTEKSLRHLIVSELKSSLMRCLLCPIL